MAEKISKPVSASQVFEFLIKRLVCLFNLNCEWQSLSSFEGFFHFKSVIVWNVCIDRMVLENRCVTALHKTGRYFDSVSVQKSTFLN